MFVWLWVNGCYQKKIDDMVMSVCYCYAYDDSKHSNKVYKAEGEKTTPESH